MKRVILFALVFVFSLSLLCGCKDGNDMDAFWSYYNGKIEIFEKENEEFKGTDVDVVFLGDSLTDGYDVKRFYPEYTVLNRGISGDTTVWLEERLDVSLYAIQPKVAVMLIGANNISTMLENYEYTTDGGHLTEKGYEVLTAAIKPAIQKQLSAWEQENSAE